MKRLAVIFFSIILIITISGCTHQTSSSASVTLRSQSTSSPKINNQKNNQITVKADNTKTAQASKASPVEYVTAKSFSWYTLPNNTHTTPQMPAEILKLLADHNAFYVLPNAENKVYLTFDEGYELAYTPQILDILKANNVKAAFFITGQYIKSQPELVKRMHAEGHLVCNHTVNHSNLSRLSAESIKNEIMDLDQKYADLTGSKMAPYIRPPTGMYSEQSLEVTKELGYTTVFWSIALNDWDPAKQPGAEYSYKYVTDHIHPGAVILLHAVSQSDTEALDRIIKDLQAQGYIFSTFN